MVQQCGENTDLMLELLGTMVYIPTDHWNHVVQRTNFIEFIHNNLVNGFAEDDIVLESVMLIATICRSEPIAEHIANSYLIKMLQDLLGAKVSKDIILMFFTARGRRNGAADPEHLLQIPVL
jgi:hypothetical protein